MMRGLFLVLFLCGCSDDKTTPMLTGVWAGTLTAPQSKCSDGSTRLSTMEDERWEIRPARAPKNTGDLEVTIHDCVLVLAVSGGMAQSEDPCLTTTGNITGVGGLVVAITDYPSPGGGMTASYALNSRPTNAPTVQCSDEYGGSLVKAAN